MKKFSLILGIMIVFIFSSATFAAGFSDVKSTAWYYSSVTDMANKGIVRGYEDGRFRPDKNITRAEFVMMLAKASGEDTTGYAPKFSDVSSSFWAHSVIGWATEKGIVAGMGNGTFLPGSAITREQMISMIYRYMTYKGFSLPSPAPMYFTDVGSISAYAKDPIGIIYGFGGINGIGNKKFSPKGIATRAQACQVLQNNLFRNQRQRCALFARNFVGWSYANGSSDPAVGFDNVGLVTYVYKQFGVELTGDAVTLQNVGTAVSLEGLNMGDLLCFGGKTPVVGIYLGNDEFLLAVNTNDSNSGVYMGKLHSKANSYYLKNFVTGRRLFNA